MRFAFALGLIFVAITSHASGTALIKYLPVQEAGRVKPYDSMAREVLQLVYGSSEYEGKPAVEIITTWMLVPQIWDVKKIVQLKHRGLKESLKLPIEDSFFSPMELLNNERLSLVMQNLRTKQETKEKLDPYYQAVQRLENQLSYYQALKGGRALFVVPVKDGGKWLSAADLDGELKDKFAQLTNGFIRELTASGGGAALKETANSVPLAQALSDFKAAARAQSPDSYADDRLIDLEVHYNNLHAFRWSWVLYLLGAVLMGIAWQSGWRWSYLSAWAMTAGAFILHCYGFGLRIYLAGRPPVSNMYESVVWVSFGAILFAMIFEILQRRRFVLLAGQVVAVVALVIADNAPSILDESIQPLEPVLRSNYWLTIHVLTISISYSAFFLAWCLGMFGLGYFIRGDEPNSERVRALTQSAYRAIQVGSVLIAAGIILGGIWADYSWGRFWGWDPKETWALIAFLGYMALLHARLTGWVQNFGMLAGSVLAFSLVIMCWYGVNYVLGAGLHSYGFGAGGVQYVAAFLIICWVYVAYAFYLRHQRA